MELNSLVKIIRRTKKRVGRGHGCGKVKTSGRGQKGQLARETVPLTFTGSAFQADWIKRLPLKRGKNKNKSFNKDKSRYHGKQHTGSSS